MATKNKKQEETMQLTLNVSRGKFKRILANYIQDKFDYGDDDIKKIDVEYDPDARQYVICITVVADDDEGEWEEDDDECPS